MPHDIDDDPIPDRPDDPPDRALALRDPSTLITIDDLQSSVSPVEIINARAAIVETARRRAIRLTFPGDWLLFRAPDGRETAYLQDAGCDRVRDVMGIEVFNVSTPERLSIDGSSSAFMYVVTGSGRSRLTMQRVEAIEGGRPSTDDFCKGTRGAQLELLVRKAARANLDGRITRELSGLANIPIDELDAAWTGTGKDSGKCPHGRGYGTTAERHGAARATTPDVVVPVCTVCPPVDGRAVDLRYIAASGTRGAFYGCPHHATHPTQRASVDAADWLAMTDADRTKQRAILPRPPVDANPPATTAPTFARTRRD